MKTNLLNKILIYVGAVAILCGVGFLLFKQNELSRRQEQIQASIVEQKALLGDIMRSGSRYGTTQELEEFISKHGLNILNLKEDLKKLDSKINSGNVIVVDSSGQTQTDIPSTSVGPENPDGKVLTDQLKYDMSICDPFGYLSRQQNLTLNEKFGNHEVPIGDVGFSAWKSNPWSITIPARQYKVINVAATDENQRTTYYNKFMVNANGKDYDINISSAQSVQQVPKASFHWWNPRLYLSTGGGYNISNNEGNVNAGINIGIMSYGKYKNQPDLSILQLGVGADFVSRRPVATVAPFNINIGNLANSSLVRNTFLGPAFQVDTRGSMSGTLQLSVGF